MEDRFNEITKNETRTNEDDLVFHYQRGSFRNQEQAIYRDLATGVTTPKRGLFKVLFSTKGNKTIFSL